MQIKSAGRSEAELEFLSDIYHFSNAKAIRHTVKKVRSQLRSLGDQ